MRWLTYLALFAFTLNPVACKRVTEAPQETIRITCWEGYAKAFVEDYKKLVKEKLKIDVKVEIYNPTDQDEFYKAAKDGTADLISPPQDLAKTPRFYCFEEGNDLLSEVDANAMPNMRHILPFFQADKSLIHEGKRNGFPYNCGP